MMARFDVSFLGYLVQEVALFTLPVVLAAENA
jgi:hypothetical protein